MNNQLPTSVSETDMLLLQLTISKIGEAGARLDLARAEKQAVLRELQQKYALAAGDQIKPDGEIQRHGA